MFKSLYVGGKAPCSRVNIVCRRRESSILASSLSENMLEGKLHVQELICWTVMFFLSPEFSKASCNVLKVYAGGKRQRVQCLQYG